jgi:hypothetical protein
MAETVEIQFGVDGKTHTLDGIPARVWEQFCTQARVLFPKGGNDAWSNFLAEFIMAQCARPVNHLLTDIPPEVAKALEDNLGAIGLEWASVHRYILMASASGNLELVRMSDGGPGAVLVLGIPEQTLKKFTNKTNGVRIAEAIGMMLLGTQTGELNWRLELTETASLDQTNHQKKST